MPFTASSGPTAAPSHSNSMASTRLGKARSRTQSTGITSRCLPRPGPSASFPGSPRSARTPMPEANRASRPEPVKGLGKLPCGFSTASSIACPPSRFARATACASGSPAMSSCRRCRNRLGESNDDETRDRLLSHPHCGPCNATARKRAVRPGPASHRDRHSASGDPQSGHSIHGTAHSIHAPRLFGAGHGNRRRSNPYKRGRRCL